MTAELKTEAQRPGPASPADKPASERLSGQAGAVSKDLHAMESAAKAGGLLGERAKAQGIETVVFDRGGYQYHGRVKAFADGVREAGLTL